MKTIAIVNYKGGVGKTVTTINLAAELSAMGKRVIVMDADGQRNLSAFYRVDEPSQGGTTYDLLTGQAEALWSDNLGVTRDEGVKIVPGSAELPKADLAALTGGEIHRNGFRDFCEAVAEDDGADYILIDCPTSYSAATVAALAAADEVIIPVELEGFALAGARDLCEQVEGLHRINPRLRVAGALITKRYRSRLQDDAEAALRATNIPVFQQSIPRRAVVAESIAAGVPLREYIPSNPATLSYQLFAQELLEIEEARRCG